MVLWALALHQSLKTQMLLNTCLSLLDKYVFVSADKAPNNTVFVCKSHCIDCLIKELGIYNSLGNPTYTPTTLTKKEILNNHKSVLCYFGISTKDEELDLPSLYWIPKLHWKQSHCDTSYSRGGVNQMCILKNSKDLLEYIQSRSISSCNSIKTFDFSTLYTTSPHSKLKDKLREFNCVLSKKEWPT